MAERRLFPVVQQLVLQTVEQEGYEADYTRVGLLLALLLGLVVVVVRVLLPLRVVVLLVLVPLVLLPSLVLPLLVLTRPAARRWCGGRRRRRESSCTTRTARTRTTRQSTNSDRPILIDYNINLVLSRFEVGAGGGGVKLAISSVERLVAHRDRVLRPNRFGDLVVRLPVLDELAEFLGGLGESFGPTTKTGRRQRFYFGIAMR